MDHMVLVGGVFLVAQGAMSDWCTSHLETPLRLWLEQPTVRPDSGSFHRGTLPPRSPSRVHTRTWIAKVMQQSHQLCHSAWACLPTTPPAMSPDVKMLIKPRPIPLEQSELQDMVLISLFSLPCDSWVKLASSSIWLYGGPLLNSAVGVLPEAESGHGTGDQNGPRQQARNVPKPTDW